MRAPYKAPGGYIEEIPVASPSVSQVEPAVPAFVGYTERARRTVDDDLLLRPTKIYSLQEYEEYFGFAKPEPVEVTVRWTAGTGYRVSAFAIRGDLADDGLLPSYLLYYAVKMYFDNGGGLCYIVSVRTYAGTSPSIDLGGGNAASTASYGLQDGVDAVALEDEPTLIVVPDAAKLGAISYAALVQAVLAQCGRLRDRFAIFDVYRGFAPQDDPSDLAGKTNLAAAREGFGMQNLNYGAAYYPFLRTSLNYATDETTVQVTYPAPVGRHGGGGGGEAPAARTLASLETEDPALYNFVKAALKEHYVTMPPSGAVAGVYAATDRAHGVWKTPANVSLADVAEPMVRLDAVRQDALSIDASAGKSINAIRAFPGKGTLMWGGRTLAGNDNEWRYISVRRFFIMVEESVKKSTAWAIFEPNDADTWMRVRVMVENYLMQLWRAGALTGATTRDAFFVRCGLGTTMSPQDILEGRMNVEIGMAVVRPTEFIVLSFSHELQTS